MSKIKEMKKIKILIPIYNDWQSVFKLLEKINFEVLNLNYEFSIIIVNDASTENRTQISLNLENLKSIKIINMKENRGHARCNAAGLKYIFEKEEFDYVIPMDGDGEDRPEEIKNFVEHIKYDKNFKLNHTQLSHNIEDCNLSAIDYMKRTYGLEVTFGSHCINLNVLYLSLPFQPSDILFYVRSPEKCPDFEILLKSMKINENQYISLIFIDFNKIQKPQYFSRAQTQKP